MSEARKSIHRYFAEFGYEIGEAVYQELRKPGGLPKLLKKLKLPDDGTAAGQYEALLTYLRTSGTQRLEEIAGLKPVDFQVGFKKPPTESDDPPPTATLPKSNVVRLEPKSERIGTGMPPPTESTVKRASERDTPDPDASSPTDSDYRPSKILTPENAAARKSPYDLVDRDGFPVGPLIPGSRPKAGSAPKGSPSFDPNKPNDPNGNWPEVERRSGRERRRLPDRRNKFDIVYANQRFGGDRRDVHERRRDWPKGGHIK